MTFRVFKLHFNKAGIIKKEEEINKQKSPVAFAGFRDSSFKMPRGRSRATKTQTQPCPERLQVTERRAAKRPRFGCWSRGPAFKAPPSTASCSPNCPPLTAKLCPRGHRK